MTIQKNFQVAILVAHPDDETLWAGGTILQNPSWQCFVVCLCRGSDIKRKEKFYQALALLHSEGIMGDLDDEPEQKPLKEEDVEFTLHVLLPEKHFDLVITHHPKGEYTRHIRHEEVGKAVIMLWHANKISTDKLWVFAYEDGNKAYYPQAVKNTPIYQLLEKQIWLEKYSIITETYGFDADSWEAKTTPPAESFWQFSDALSAKKWLNSRLNHD